MLATIALAFGGWGFTEPFVWPTAWSADGLPNEAGGIFQLTADGPPDTFNAITLTSDNDVLFFSDDAPLLRRDPRDDSWLPHAAESYDVSGDGRTVTVRLRPELTWSDGSPIRADDYLFRVEAESDPEVQSGNYDSWVLSPDGSERITVAAPDPLTVEFTLPRPDRIAFERIARLSPAPDHVLGEIYRAGGADALIAAWGPNTDPADTVWAGPFVPVGTRAGERYVLERNPHYGDWNVDERGRPLPYLDRIVLRYVFDAAAADALFLTEETDILVSRNPAELAGVQRLIARDELEARVFTDTGLPEGQTNLLFNWNRASDPVSEALLRDVRFRRAISHLMDRRGLSQVGFGTDGTPQWSSVYPAYEFWIPDDLPTYPFDPERAGELFDELGYDRIGPGGIRLDADGNRLEMELVTNAGGNERLRMLRVLADEAERAGLDLQLRIIDFNVLVDLIEHQPADDRPFEMMVVGTFGDSRAWPFRGEAHRCDGWEHLYNRSGECLFEAEAEIGRLAELGRRTVDDDEALAIAHEIQRLQMELLPALYLPVAPLSVAFLNRVAGLYPEELMSWSQGFGVLPLQHIREGYE